MLFAFEYSPFLLFAIFSLAILYSSVGHGGASGYIAAMALWGLAPQELRPAVLTMNIVVTAWVLFRMLPFKLLPHHIFWPCVLASVPMAFIGGLWKISTSGYYLVLGSLLFIAGARLVFPLKPNELCNENSIAPPRMLLVLIIGGVLGFTAGVSGIGGGVFLSPILIFLGWCSVRQTAAVAAGFIFLNSLSGLFGFLMSNSYNPDGLGWLLVTAFAGCLIGSEMASHRSPEKILSKLLCAVLLIAAIKMIYLSLG